MIITNGNNSRALRDVFSGDFKGTLFLPGGSRLSVRKKWIGFVSHAKGSVSVDDGARTALLTKHRSLLPSGILDISGEFRANDTITVCDARGHEIARGVTHYSSADLEKIRGRKSGEIAKILGRHSRDEVIHKDNLVIITGSL
jgi:glutamate 5-kinase